MRIFPALHFSHRLHSDDFVHGYTDTDMKPCDLARDRSAHLLQVLVAVDELALVRVLQFVGLHVLPQSLDDDRSGLGVDPEHTSKPGVQLKLRGLDRNNRVALLNKHVRHSHLAEWRTICIYLPGNPA